MCRGVQGVQGVQGQGTVSPDGLEAGRSRGEQRRREGTRLRGVHCWALGLRLALLELDAWEGGAGDEWDTGGAQKTEARHLPQSGLWELLTPRLEGGTPTRTYTQAPPPQPAQGLPVVRSQGTRIPLWVIGDGDNAALLLLLLDTTRGKEGMGGNSGREG
ncbi:hypothetical protein B484DRAFT_421901 [Ochromonadaceae sp. CCMP2298]|nr:hypothetical protein B484DRAFT_421901 [Ochromonadaceae sp. CCMP2298]